MALLEICKWGTSETSPPDSRDDDDMFDKRITTIRNIANERLKQDGASQIRSRQPSGVRKRSILLEQLVPKGRILILRRGLVTDNRFSLTGSCVADITYLQTIDGVVSGSGHRPILTKNRWL